MFVRRGENIHLDKREQPPDDGGRHGEHDGAGKLGQDVTLHQGEGDADRSDHYLQRSAARSCR